MNQAILIQQTTLRTGTEPEHVMHPPSVICQDERRTRSWFRPTGGYAVSLLRAGVSRFTRWRQRRRTYRALQALDNGALKDLGLGRSEIPYLAQTLSDEPAGGQETE